MNCTKLSPCKYGIPLFASVILITSWIFSVSGQITINIAYGTGNTGRPAEGEIYYQLDCIIADISITTPVPARAWAKDSNLLFWSTGTPIDLDRTGDYTVTETGSNPIRFILTITTVGARHSGVYTCFAATGDLISFSVVAEAKVGISVVGGPSTPTVNPAQRPYLPGEQYFPDSQWPKCYPQADIRVLIYTELDIRCVSTPGNPPIEVNIYRYDTSSVQRIRDSDTAIIETDNLIEQIYTYQVTPTEQFNEYSCQIIRPGDGMNRQCRMGNIGIRLFYHDVIEVRKGTFAVFNCLAGSSNTIMWSTEPPIMPLRLLMDSTNLQINNVQMADNGTKVICRVEGYDLQDEAVLIVTTDLISPNIESTTTTSTVIASPTSPSKEAASTTFELYSRFPSSTSGTPTMPTTKLGNSEETADMTGQTVGVAIGVGVIIFIAGLVFGMFCMYKWNRYNLKAKRRHSSSNPDDISNHNSNSELRNAIPTISSDHQDHHRINSQNAQPSNESYTGLRLQDVHQSEYASLKKENETDESKRDYVNVNPQRHGEPTYEVNIVASNI